MCPVASVICGIVGNFTRIYGEVIAVDVVHIAVSVIIDARLAVELRLIYQHVCGKVRMVVFHTAVDDGHDHPRVSSCQFPGLCHIDVCTGHGLCADGLVGIVDIMPLPEQLRVIEIGCHRSPGHAVGCFRERYGLARIGPVHPGIELDAQNLRHLGKLGSRLVKILLRRELQKIPPVKPCGAGTLLVFPGIRVYPLK